MRININKRKKININKLIIVLLTIFTILILLIGYKQISNSLDTSTIRQNVYIDDIQVGGLTKEQAKTKLLSYNNNKYSEFDISFTWNDYIKSLSANSLYVFDNNDAIEKALNIPHKISIIKPTPIYYTSKKSINLKKVESIINEISNDINSPIDNSSIKVYSDRVVVHVGKTSSTVNNENLRKTLINNINNLNFDNIEIEVITNTPFKISTDKICSLVNYNISYYKSDGSISIINSQSNKIVDSKYIDYLLTKYIDFTIDIEIIPEKAIDTSLSENFFLDELSSYTTLIPITDENEFNRSVNIALVSDKIDGVILYPGEIFSYNDVVGRRTAAKGYKTAHVFVNGKIIDGIGGGICQVSSTMYNASLNINLEIIERHYHQFTVDYVPLGQDAAVSFGTQDFKIKNTTNWPIIFECIVEDVISDEYATEAIIENQTFSFRILGTKNNESKTYNYYYNILETRPYETIIQYDSSFDSDSVEIVQQGQLGYIIQTIKETYTNNIKTNEETISYSYYKPYPQIELHYN